MQKICWNKRIWRNYFPSPRHFIVWSTRQERKKFKSILYLPQSGESCQFLDKWVIIEKIKKFSKLCIYFQIWAAFIVTFSISRWLTKPTLTFLSHTGGLSKPFIIPETAPASPDWRWSSERPTDTLLSRRTELQEVLSLNLCHTASPTARGRLLLLFEDLILLMEIGVEIFFDVQILIFTSLDQNLIITKAINQESPCILNKS